LVVAEDADVDNAVEEEPGAVLEERVETEDDVDETLEAVLEEPVDETADPDEDDRDDDEVDWLSVEIDEPDVESDCAAARPTSPTKAARKCMLV
jgi:hypothetical protein